MNFYLIARKNQYCLSHTGHKNGRRCLIPTTIAVSCNRSSPVYRDISLGIALRHINPQLYSLTCSRCVSNEDTLDALRPRSFLALFYAPIGIVYNHKYSSVLCARRHPLWELWNYLLANLAWLHSHQNLQLQDVSQAATDTCLATLERWNQCLQ